MFSWCCVSQGGVQATYVELLSVGGALIAGHPLTCELAIAALQRCYGALLRMLNRLLPLLMRDLSGIRAMASRKLKVLALAWLLHVHAKNFWVADTVLGIDINIQTT